MSWQAEYFDGTNLGGMALATRSEGGPGIANADALPDAVKKRGGKDNNSENFSVRWTGDMNGPGKFKFTFKTDDGMRAHLKTPDGRQVQLLNEWRDHVGHHIREVTLSAGPHVVVIEFYNKSGAFTADITYERTGGQSEQDKRKAWQQVTAPGHLTRGGLEAARIYEVDADGEPIFNSLYPILYCMFNPDTYKVTKASAFSGKGLDDNKNYNVDQDNSKVKPSTLDIPKLWFDTSEAKGPDGLPEDVSKYTDALIEFAESTAVRYSANFRDAETAKAAPPKLAFQWGTFRFLGVIESVKVKFIHFSPEGIPLRAQVTLKMKEFRHRKAYPKQNPTSGEGPMDRVWRVQDGQRLDSIAAQVYGDATEWRTIALHNKIEDPFNLPIGLLLRLPPI
ncbi:MAG: hypothetical protein OT477_17805 [Chloroflexi bacterium]|nr:hypothetical protein [Chloroflexota bacterium]